MFTYLINDEEVTFENRVDLIKALEQAEMMGYSIEDITDKKKKEKKKEKEEDSTEVSKAPAEKSMIEKMDSPNFAEDLATSASDGSDVFAQEGTELPLEDTSLELPPVTIDDIDAYFAEDQQIDLPTLTSVLEGDENRIKEFMQILARTPNMSMSSEQIGADANNPYAGTVGTLSYTNPDTGKVEDSFDLRIDGADLRKNEILAKSNEFNKFINKYVSKNALANIGAQAAEINKKKGIVTKEEAVASLGVTRENFFTATEEVIEDIYAGTDIRPGMQGIFDSRVKEQLKYDKEIAETIKALSEENPKKTKEELTEEARDIVWGRTVETERLRLLQNKVDDYLSANEKDRGLYNLGTAVTKTKVLKEREKQKIILEDNIQNSESLQKSLNIAAKYVSGDVNDAVLNIQGKKINLGDLSDGSDILQFKNGVRITQNQVDLLEQAEADLKVSLENFNPKLEELQNIDKKLGDLGVQLKAAGLNFSILDKSASTLFTGLGSIGASLGMFGAKTINIGLRGGMGFSAYNPSVRQVFDDIDESLDELGSDYSEYKESIRSSYTRDYSVKEGFSSLKGFGRFAAQEISTQAPVLIAMAASGGTLAPYVVGAWTAGEKMMDLAYENTLMTEDYKAKYADKIDAATGEEKDRLKQELADKIRQDKVGAFDMYARGIGVGLANGVFTALTTNPILQRGIKMYKTNGLGKEFLLNTKEYWKMNWKRNLVYDNALEVSGELATNVFENLIDGRPIFENADHVAISSIGFSFAFSGLPFLQGAGIRALSSTKTTREIDARQQKIFKKTAIYEKIKDKRTKMARDLKAELAELTTAQAEAVEKAIDRAANGIDSFGSAMGLIITKRINGARAKARDIVNDKALNYAEKQEMLKDLEIQFDRDVNARENYLDVAAFGDNFALLKSGDNNKYNSLIEQAQKELGTNDINKKVEQRASDIFRAEQITEKFEKNHKNNKNAVLAATQKEAINTINKLDATPKAKNDAITNIKDGGGGVNIELNSGETFAVAVTENQVAQAKLGVMEHEISHGVMDKIFANSPKKLNQMRKQVEAWMKKNHSSLDFKIQLNLQNYKNDSQLIQDNEYLANFFEIIGEGKLDISGKENRAFAGLTGFMMQDMADGVYDFDFKGTNDFVAFAISVGKGIKNGTVDISNVSKIKESVEALDIKEDTKKKDTKPKVSKSMRIEALEQAYFDLQDQAAEDPNNLALYERMEKAGDALDAALAAPAAEATPATEAAQEAPKEVIVRPKADKSKRKYSLDKEVKKEIEPKIAEAQKLNKELIEQEKKLNADAIAEIEAIDDNVESRTSREKRIVALKNKPLTVRKPPALNKLEKEITEALETPINKAVNLFTKLYYDKIAKNATAAVTREEFMQSAKAEITNLTINEFKPETINRAGENVINDIEDIIFQRGGLRLRNLAQRLGVIGKEQGVARGAEALTKIAAEDSSSPAETSEKKLDSGFKGEIRKPSALLANEALIEQAKKKIIQFWETNKGNKKVENFKNLPIIIDSILAEVYGISLSTLTSRSGNFNKATYQNAITAFTEKQAVFRTEENGEMVEVRVPYDQRDAKLEELKSKAKENSNFTFEEYSPESRAEGILRFLPELSVPEYKYFSGKRGRSAGKSTGMPRSFTKLAYLVTGRRTQAQGNLEGEIQKISRQELLEAIGAIDDANGNAVPDVAKANEAGKAVNKMPGAQTLLSLIKLEGRMIANQMSREFGNLDPMTELDIKMGKNKTMYSAPLKIILAPANIEMFKPENFKNKAIPYEAADSIYKILQNENKIRKKKLNIIQVSNIILKETAKQYGREVGAVYRNAALDVMQKFDPAGYKIAEAKIKLIKDLQYSFGEAFKYVVENKAINNEWGKVEALKNKGVSKETKIQVIKDYVERWNRAGRDIDYRRDFDFLKATNNTAVFDAIKEATGLSNTQLKNLGFTLEKIGGLTTINFKGKPLKLSTSADSLKKDLNSKDVAKNNAAAITINKEASTIRKVMFDILDPFIKKGDIEGAKAALALMNLSQNGIARKLAKMGSIIKINANDKTILDHNPSMSDVNAKIIEYIEGKRSKTSLNNYLDKTTINNISEQLNDLLDLKGGLDSNRYDVLKNVYAKINVNYAAKEVAVAKENNYSLPLNLRQEGISSEESIKRVENFNKAITLGNSLDQPTKGISIWDFDDTLAKTKSSVLYTMPGEVKIYHGGAIKSAKDIKGDFVYFSEEKTQADEYAKGNQGEVTDFVLNENNIASEEAVFEVIKELGIQPKTKGYKVDELNLYELIDPRFKKESFSKTDLARLAKALKNKGIKAARFSDTNLKSGKEILNIVVFDKSSVKRRGKLDAAEFAKKGDAMLANGAEFDFSEFSKVVKGEKGPFFEKAMARNKKFGNENVFILTARPANSALAIHEFLKGVGLDIPLANITGLANSDPQAKANWVVGKFAEGYNDFYFADDHIGNVKAVKDVLSQLDVKSKVQQARVRYSMDLNKRFNEIIEEKSGIESFKEYKSAKAGKKGAKKGRLSFFIPPSAEDFMGLLYKTLPKGKKGESAMAFYKEHLIDPYWKGVSGLRTQRISIAKQYRALKKELGIVPRKLKKTFKYEDENGNMKESLFSKEDAIRVYVWDAQGFDVEGLSNVDLPVLVNYVNSQPELKAFADRLLEINKNNNPKAPTESWTSGTITSDLLNTLNTEGRKKMLEVWQQNVDVIFSKTNLNKLEAAFGANYVEALKSSLDAMSTGQNSKPTGHRVTDGFVRWLNAAVGNIMFLNRRSAVLQLISFTNFINFEGNNLYQAARAFANQPQYWKDWVMLMNSDYLVDRRDGLKINVNEADIATTAKENGFQGVLAKVLQLGFLPTKMADSVAIATGGASFYRNKVNALVKDGMNLEAAEKQAMQEFIKTAETSQQSSDPAMTSKQQREPVGRIILAFANTPSQYARIIKRSTQDLIAGRGNPKTHLSRIAYYGFLQNAIFNFLQQGLFAAMMGDDDEDERDDETPETTAKKEESRNKKMFKTANSMVDGILRGIGVGGAVVSAAKNLAIKYYERSKKTRNQRLAETLVNGVVAVSPPIGSKLSKVSKVGNTMEWGKKEIEFDEMSLKHPYVTAASNAIAAATGLPTDRAVGMAIDAVDIASSETETWMKPLIALGWPKWQLMSDEDTQKEREEKKERFKELEADKEFQELNPTEQRRAALKVLSKKEQEEILWNSGVLTRKQIRNLKTEANRIDKIMGLRDRKQFEKDMESLSKGGDILPEPKPKRPVNKRKNSLK